MSSAVNDRLTGYAVIMVWNVGSCGNTSFIHAIHTPHTPMVINIAGARDIPKPRR